jgi:hypothetical protein
MVPVMLTSNEADAEATPLISYLGSAMRIEAFPNGVRGEVALHVKADDLSVVSLSSGRNHDRLTTSKVKSKVCC